ncbi:MAG: RIO1 family regulatory kinase/ATPase domain-containing protein [Candidatus Helarchaeota archaeon]
MILKKILDFYISYRGEFLLEILNILKKLRDGDFHILNSIERGMKKYLYVPLDVLTAYSGYTVEDIEFYLGRVQKYGLIEKRREKYLGYKLKFRGYDCLALNALIKADIIEAFGPKLGVGKEAEVYDVILAGTKERAAIKIHRVGGSSFHNVKRYRSYIENRRHISWLYVSRLAAIREFDAMKILYHGNLPVPKPIFHNRHVIVMSLINGKLLADIRFLNKPEKILNKILDFIYLAFNKFDVIHSDLSEFNIMIDKNQNVLIFDFPQWINSKNPQFKYYLKRDIINILDFFRRKFQIIIDEELIFNKFNV